MYKLRRPTDETLVLAACRAVDEVADGIACGDAAMALCCRVSKMWLVVRREDVVADRHFDCRSGVNGARR